jgi:hypothetical protein
VRHRLVLLVVAAAVGAGCSDGGESEGATVSPATAARAASDPAVITGEDGRTYRVAGRGEMLTLDDVAVRVTRVRWEEPRPGAAVPPGTDVVAVVTLVVANRSEADQRVAPLQFWFVDAAGNTHLGGPAGGGPRLPGATLAPGAELAGRLAFPLPVRTDGSLLVYRFADAGKIAGARRMGLVRLAP